MVGSNMHPSTSLQEATVAPGIRAEGRPRVGGELLQAYLFISPALLLLTAFVIVPAVWVLWLSFYRWDLITSSADFVGLGNFDRLLHDRLWWKTLAQTVYFVAVSVPAGMALSLTLAVLLSGRFRGRALVRGAVFAPFVTPAVATILIWEWIFNKDYGLLNAVLQALHLPAVGWLTDPRWIMPSIIIYTLWSTVGFNTVIFLAGLANIPPHLQEAARVDGAGTWQVFWRITFPLLTPTTYFVLLISSINSFKVFNAVFVLAGSENGAPGGPDRAGLTVAVYLYNQAFQFFRAGYASAISVALFAIVLTLTLLQMRIAARRVFYQ